MWLGFPGWVLDDEALVVISSQFETLWGEKASLMSRLGCVVGVWAWRLRVASKKNLGADTPSAMVARVDVGSTGNLGAQDHAPGPTGAVIVTLEQTRMH